MDYLDRLRQRLRNMPLLPPPPPWRKVADITVGGLTEVGFGDGTDLLLVVTHSGRGVFDGLTGERLARDYDDPDPEWYDPDRLTARGVGPLAGALVRLAGLHGGGLPRVTPDGWKVELAYPDWPRGMVVMEPLGRSVYDERRAADCRKVADIDLPRGYGFSPTGRVLVVAQGHGFLLLARD